MQIFCHAQAKTQNVTLIVNNLPCVPKLHSAKIHMLIKSFETWSSFEGTG
jgi:hypothetical protein